MKNFLRVSVICLLAATFSGCIVGPGYYGHCWQNWRGVEVCN